MWLLVIARTNTFDTRQFIIIPQKTKQTLFRENVQFWQNNGIVRIGLHKHKICELITQCLVQCSRCDRQIVKISNFPSRLWTIKYNFFFFFEWNKQFFRDNLNEILLLSITYFTMDSPLLPSRIDYNDVLERKQMQFIFNVGKVIAHQWFCVFYTFKNDQTSNDGLKWQRLRLRRLQYDADKFH